MDFIEPKTFYSISHIIGVAVGAGASFLSDGIFFRSIKDGRFSKTEIDFLRLGSRFVWAGLLILFISGLLLFYTNPDRYMVSSKFWAKMTIVVVIAVNGLIFRKVHIKNLEKNKISFTLFASGAVSVVSWLSAIVLGSLRSLPLGYWTIVGAYLVILAVAILIAAVSRKIIFGLHNS